MQIAVKNLINNRDLLLAPLQGVVTSILHQLFIQGKKKSAGKMITGFQFVSDDPEKVMITSADSEIRIVDGADVIQKYRGPRKSKRQPFASFTEDGRHIISVGDDSSIFIWNCKNPNPASSSSKNSKSIRSCEHFFSKDVSIALDWQIRVANKKVEKLQAELIQKTLKSLLS